MSEHRIPKKDILYAAALEIGSQLSLSYPAFGKLFGPNGRPRRWFLTDTHADDVPWLEATGTPVSGRIPSHYRMGVVMQAPAELPRHKDGLPRWIAAAYPVGKAVLATEVYTPVGQEWSPEPTVLFGIGKGPFSGMIGHLAVAENGVRSFESFPNVQMLTPKPQPVDQLAQAYPTAVRV